MLAVLPAAGAPAALGVVRPGVSGFMLPKDSAPEEFARTMQECISDRARYQALCWSARQFYDQSLSWDVFGERLMAILENVSRGNVGARAA